MILDREKIICEWETILSRDPLDVPWDLIDDTLTLLKEQEAKKMHWGMYCGVYDTCTKVAFCSVACQEGGVGENVPDLVAVIRCKDCKYRCSEIRGGIKFAKCELKHNWMPQADWFCADGESKSADEILMEETDADPLG